MDLKAISLLESYKGKLQELSGSKPIDLSKIDDAIREARAVKEDFELTTLWLCGYVMDLHDFRNGILKINKDTKHLDSVMNFVAGEFPMLQGSSNHRQFLHFRKQVNVKDINENIKNVMEILRERTDLK